VWLGKVQCFENKNEETTFHRELSCIWLFHSQRLCVFPIEQVGVVVRVVVCSLRSNWTPKAAFPKSCWISDVLSGRVWTQFNVPKWYVLYLFCFFNSSADAWWQRCLNTHSIRPLWKWYPSLETVVFGEGKKEIYLIISFSGAFSASHGLHRQMEVA